MSSQSGQQKEPDFNGGWWSQADQDPVTDLYQEAMLDGSGTAMLDGSGAAMLNGSGTAMLDGSGTAMLDGSGAAMLDGSGTAMLDGSGAAMLDFSGAAMLDSSGALQEEVKDLMSQRKVEVARREEHQLLLQKDHDKAVRQHQVLLEKLESLRVKLQLNDSKASRKSFLHKKQEMTSQKNRTQEENNRLQKQLGEMEERLISLQEEQEQEKRLLEGELSQLTEAMERVRETSQEAEKRALKDEMVAIEKQRDGAIFSMEAWLREVGQYLQALRMDPSQPHLQERRYWEKQETLVRKRRDQLQAHFQGLLQQLGEGCPLDALSREESRLGAVPPPLPKVPTVELIISQILLSLEQATFHLQQAPSHPSPPPSMPPPRTPPPARILSTMGQQAPPRTPPPTRIISTMGQQAPSRTPPPTRIISTVGQQAPPRTPPPARTPSTVGQQAPPRTPPPAHIPSTLGQQAPPRTPPPLRNTPPPSSGPAVKLDLLLDHLGAKFPQCSRAQLMTALQQIKSERGTMAGLSRDEVTKWVGLRLARGPVPVGPAPLAAPQPLRLAAKSFCLMCQQEVEPGRRQPLPCDHSIHPECISVWLRSSGRDSCPFCPAR